MITDALKMSPARIQARCDDPVDDHAAGPHAAATDLRGSPVGLGFQFVFSPGHDLRADPGGR